MLKFTRYEEYDYKILKANSVDFRGGYRTSATSKLESVNYYHKALHLGCCRNPRSASEFGQREILSVIVFTVIYNFFWVFFVKPELKKTRLNLI